MDTEVTEVRDDAKAYCLDGEEAHIQPLGREFPFALGFLTHMLRNIERKNKIGVASFGIFTFFGC